MLGKVASQVAGEQVVFLRLATALVVLLAVVLVHGLLELRRQWSPAPSYLWSGTPGWVEAGVVADRVALDFAAQCAEWRYSFVESTYPIMQERFKQCLHPVLARSYRAEEDQEAQAVRKGQLATQFTVVERRITARKGPLLTVMLKGIRGRTLGDTRLPDETVTITGTLLPWVEQGVPTQLVLTTFEVSPKLGL